MVITTMKERINTGGICHIAIDVSDLELVDKILYGHVHYGHCQPLE